MADDIGEESVPGRDDARETGSAKFDEKTLDSTVIAVPLINEIAKEKARKEEAKKEGEAKEEEVEKVFELIVDLNLQHAAGMRVARDIVYIQILGYEVWLQFGANPMTVEYLTGVRETQATDLTQWQGVTERSVDKVVDLAKATYTPQYVYPKLTAREISALVAIDAETMPHALYKVWPDFDVEMMLTSSVATVKGDAARVAFSASGEGIVWAVADTGIDGSHPHFEEHKNLDLNGHLPLKHIDFTGDTTATLTEPEDNHGHGTHVAGIIAGESTIKEVEAAPLGKPEDNHGQGTHVAESNAGESTNKEVEAKPREWMPERWAGTAERDKEGNRRFARRQIKKPIAGCAPLAKLVSLKVLKDSGTGKVSNLLAATGYVQEMNDHGRLIRIHGLNMSVGYGFDPEWFGCGQSPLCVEVDRLVRSGVSVVVAAGNTGYWQRGGTEAVINSGLDLTINDPGNAELAITVGSTHREKPHTYGVSYFSSKGPTGDGRQKPDLVAPGEKVLSCAAGKGRDDIQDELTGADEGKRVDYRQESGTSMAAPHVSGAIAAFLSVRTEFIGQPQRVKETFLSSATDLGRDRYFQGHGLVDVMRAMQSL